MSDQEVDSGAESSDIYEESSGSDDEDSSSENEDVADQPVPKIWTRIYPPEDLDSLPFTARNVGARNNPPPESRPITYLSLFLTPEVLRCIVSETKKYADQQINSTISQGKPLSVRTLKWRRLNFDVAMLKKFLGLVINMGLVEKKDLVMYWDTKNPNTATPFFSSILSRNTFQLISRYLHCSDNTSNSAQHNSPNYDPLHKFRLLDSLNSGCKRYYVPAQCISIDESLIGMKNRTQLIQYIPNKHHHKWGVKLYSVTKSSTGFPLHTMVYCGKRGEGPPSDKGHSFDVVDKLINISGLTNKGYHLFVDNFYTSVTLAEHLYDKGVMLTGTMRSNRKGIPKMIKQAKPKIQECIYAKNVHTLVLSWKEKKSQKKPCIMLSTGLPSGMVEHPVRGGGTKPKPPVVSEYNKHMGGVDTLDQKSLRRNRLNTTSQTYSKCLPLI
ncbi:PiggyBac transposable element-derived protein 4 [Exaiptasia diaphana]|nr:PiggyBac transposable element-derived protein 4 [Exaiptasia diaphana]